MHTYDPSFLGDRKDGESVQVFRSWDAEEHRFGERDGGHDRVSSLHDQRVLSEQGHGPGQVLVFRDLLRGWMRLGGEVLPQQFCTRSAPVLFERNGDDKGWPKFMEKRVLEASLKNDRFIIICTVSIMVVPPSDYHRNLGQLLESRIGADVTFDVRGRMFAAHRSVLAAQSMVFQKELYGPMRESGMPCIKIEDMESTVFETLLHFVYNDSLPELDKGSTIFIVQHLLEASDRYDLQRLKLICERELYKGINVETVASNLVLADQHQCYDLKAACLDFMAFRGKLDAISKTDGYKHLIASGHPVLNELVMKLGKQVVGHATKK